MHSFDDHLASGIPTRQDSPPVRFVPDDATQLSASRADLVTPLPHTLSPLPEQSQQHSRQGRRLVTLLLVVSLLLICSVVLLPMLFAPSSGLTIASLPPPRASVPSQAVGLLSFTSSGQLDPTSSKGLNDGLTLTLAHLTPPPTGMSLYAWLLPDTGLDTFPPMLLGTLQVNANSQAQLTYQDGQHMDLLVHYSRFLVTQQAAGSPPTLPPLDQTTWKYQGAIPATPIPGDAQGYSLLAHLRHLLASDPTLQDLGLQGGLDIWLYRNTGKVFEWTNAARDDWGQPGSADLIRHLADRIVEYLDGQVYAGLDLPSGTPWLVDPQAGRPGLIDVTTSPEQPPAYISHVRQHLTGLVQAPGHTQAQERLATQLDAVLTQIEMTLRQVRKDAIQLAAMSNSQLASQAALTLLNDVQVNASNAYIGQGPTGGTTPGIVGIHVVLQQLAQIPVTTA